mmetsp:Transcript_24028/g.29419  ORF Transcript_24028/g.29419 Transcript_24028/m.29419 type:complete len:781 (+) Transcript_24028:798-3140(+)
MKIKEEETRLKLEEARLKEEQEMVARKREAEKAKLARQLEDERMKREREIKQRDYEQRQRLENEERQRLQKEQRLLAEAERLEHNRAKERRKIQKQMAKEQKRIQKEKKKYELQMMKMRAEEEKGRLKEEEAMRVEAARMEKERMEEIKRAMEFHEKEKRVLAALKEQREVRLAQQAYRAKIAEEGRKRAEEIMKAQEDDEKIEREILLQDRLLALEKEQRERDAFERRLRDQEEQQRELEAARIQQEKRAAEQRIKNAMEEVNRRLEHVEAQQKEREELEKQKKIEEALNEVSKGLLQVHDVSPEQLKEDQARIKQLYDEVEAMANKEAEEKYRSRGSSLSSTEFQTEAREIMKKLQSTYAGMESQARAEEQMQKAEYTIINQGYDVYMKTIEAAKSWWEPLVDRILGSETWNSIVETNEKIIRTFVAMNKLLLRQARTQEWFVRAENRVNHIRDAFMQEMAEVEKQRGPITKNNDSNVRNTLKRHMTIGGGGDGVRRLNSVMVLKKRDADRPAETALEHINKVKALIESGELPPSTMSDLQAMMENVSGKNKNRMSIKRRYKENKFENDEQDLNNEDESDPYPKVRPSDDKTISWCQIPLNYKAGHFYFATNPGFSQSGQNIAINFLCAWEHGNPKMSDKFFSYWNSLPSIAKVAQIYEALIQSSTEEEADFIPQFPGWIEKNYSKYASGQDKNKRTSQLRLLPLNVLNTCIDERIIKRNPNLVGLWLQDVFSLDVFKSNTRNIKAQKVLVNIVKVIEEAFDLDLNGGTNLLTRTPPM